MAGDDYQDKDGNTVSDGNNGNKKIRDIYKKELAVVKNGLPSLPYWSPDNHFYTIGTRLEGSHYCDQIDNPAITLDGVSPKTLTMCPRAFMLSPGGKNSDKTATLGQNQPTDGQSLQNLQSISLTFLHEVIHVSRSVKQTTLDAAGTEYCKYPTILADTRRSSCRLDWLSYTC